MENDTVVLSTASSVLEDGVASNDNNTDAYPYDPAIGLWRYGWPPLCVMGLVGNTLVLLVLRRDGLVRTSANVYLSALAVGDSIVLVAGSVAWYPGLVWHWWLEDMSELACRTLRQLLSTLAGASCLFVVAFTVERCVVVRFPLLKLRLCTPRNAGLCCLSLSLFVFFTNVYIIFIYDLTAVGSGGGICQQQLRYQDFAKNCQLFSIVVSIIIPTCTVVVCNWAILQTLRRNLVPAAANDTVRRTTFMCLGVSIAYIVCIIPYGVVLGYYTIWPTTEKVQNGVVLYVLFLRYVHHAINFFLYSLTGAHFRCELVALYRSWIRSATSVTAVCRKPHRRFEDEMEMRL